MSPDQLTAQPDLVAEAVRAVLVGRDLQAAALTAGLDPADLEDAAGVYHAAGAAALQHRADSRWHHVRVRFSDWNSSEQTMANVLGPALDQLPASGTPSCWWFVRKHPHWRIRLLDTDTQAVGDLLDKLTAAGTIAGWQRALYEAETAAFGGPAGIAIAHELFCADSHGVLDYARHDVPPIGRRELSVLLINAMMTAAGLDRFERGDVFDRIARLRPELAAGYADRMEQLAAQLRALLTAPASALLTDRGMLQAVRFWFSAFENAGRQFSNAAEQGHLTRGTRAILAHAVIFHWNRLGLSATTQGILARAAIAVYLPSDPWR
jgi:thiopeptide-type bacteriocin biosynthesis protein